tara:strand:+ start:12541 stop:12945 length:405 start_codon:yes stop_codon:yes gene_type:complete
MDKIKKIVKNGVFYAIIVKSDYTPKKTEFVTDNEHLQQLGFIVYKAGSIIKPHMHKVLKRTIDKTTETLFVKQGKVEYKIYDNDKSPVATGVLNKGDIIALINGGHGFKIIEDAIMIEVKQGPYISSEKDKKRF